MCAAGASAALEAVIYPERPGTYREDGNRIKMPSQPTVLTRDVFY